MFRAGNTQSSSENQTQPSDHNGGTVCLERCTEGREKQGPPGGVLERNLLKKDVGLERVKQHPTKRKPSKNSCPIAVVRRVRAHNAASVAEWSTEQMIDSTEEMSVVNR